MSLLRLLTTGRSLVGLKEIENRYRLTSQRLLPQFGPVKNPFHDSGDPAPKQPVACPSQNPGRDGTSAQSCGIRRPHGNPATDQSSGLQDRAVSARKSGNHRAVVLCSRFVGFLGVLGATVMEMCRRRRGQAAKPVISRFTRQTVQGELTLDKIKVVRNDLNDADLEIVPSGQPIPPVCDEPVLQPHQGAGDGVRHRVEVRALGSSNS